MNHLVVTTETAGIIFEVVSGICLNHVFSSNRQIQKGRSPIILDEGIAKRPAGYKKTTPKYERNFSTLFLHLKLAILHRNSVKVYVI
jgi:hypothetical protein